MPASSGVPQHEVVGGGLRHGGQNPFDHGVRGDVFGQRVIGQHQAVPQHVRGEIANVLPSRRDHVAQAAPAPVPPAPIRSDRAGWRRTRSCALARRARTRRLAVASARSNRVRVTSRSTNPVRATAAYRSILSSARLSRTSAGSTAIGRPRPLLRRGSVVDQELHQKRSTWASGQRVGALGLVGSEGHHEERCRHRYVLSPPIVT